MTTPPPHLPARAASDPSTSFGRRGEVSRWPLLWTILGAVGLGGVATVGTYWLLGRVVVINHAEGLTGAQRLTAAFATATAMGAIVALVVNVRKQDLAERTAARDVDAAFTDRFRAASQQLGAAAPLERIAGVYAMAALADDYAGRRQQCVHVLCGYLRLPWDPDLDDLAATSTTVTETADGTTTARTTTPARRPHDAQVRATILAVIAAHASDPNTPTNWTDLDFNLRGSHLHDVNLTDCRFTGSVDFGGATFSGDRTWFIGATFSGEGTSFIGATFSGDRTSFRRATFSGEGTSFIGATFSGDRTSFTDATFSGDRTSFRRATFSGKVTSFRGATFSGEVTSFIDATFSGRTEFAVAVVCAGATLQLPRFMDPNSMLAGLRIEAGAKVLVDGKRYTLPDPPKTQEEGSP